MKLPVKSIANWAPAVVIAAVFLPSLPFKFSAAPETQHIFGTIGQWLGGFLGETIGQAFSDFGGYVIGSLELITSLILLAPLLVVLINKFGKKSLKPLDRAKFHVVGGLATTALTGGAIFFHLFSKLGVNVNGDGGALFFSAVAAFISGIILFLVNRERPPCKSQTMFGKVINVLTPRSWKHWLFWAELIPAVLVLIVMAALSFYVHQAYTDRYPDQEIASVPVFTETILPFEHEYTIEKSLPFFASAVIDVDNNGVEEVFLGGGLNQADVLYQYNEDGTFTDVSAKHNIGLDKNSESHGVAVLDMDNNGWDDLVIARENDVFIAFNEGGTFTETKLNLPFNDISAPLSVALGDINKDGWADMYVAAYIKNRFVEGQTKFNDHTYGASSLLFLNNGDNTFTDITESAGMTYIHNTFQGNFVDLDLDLDLDLVVSYDTGQVRTWRNNGDLTFTSVENPNNLDDLTKRQYGYPMGNAFGDYNNDGLIDMAFSNVGDMGPMNLVIRGDLTDDQIFNPDIIVLRNDGDFKFTDTAKETNLADYEFSWGMLFEDFNADTLEDLIISENYVQLPYNHLVYLPGRTLFQAENGKFADKEKETNTINRAFEIAALATDFNNDGALDMVRANLQGKSKVQINGGHGNRFLKVKLPNVASSIGANVVADLRSGKTLTKQFITSEGLSSDGTHILFFGLGPDDVVEKLTITYLSGEVQVVENPPTNTLLTLQR